MNLIALIKERAQYYKWALADCDVKVLNEADGCCTVEVTCAKCGVSVVAVPAPEKAKHPDCLQKAASEGPIRGDELLDVHEVHAGLPRFHEGPRSLAVIAPAIASAKHH